MTRKETDHSYYLRVVKSRRQKNNLVFREKQRRYRFNKKQKRWAILKAIEKIGLLKTNRLYRKAYWYLEVERHCKVVLLMRLARAGYD